MKKKQLIIVLLSLLVCISSWIIIRQGVFKRADAQAARTSVIQATLPKPLARLDGLDRLYFQHVGRPAEVLNAPPAVASLLPEFLRVTDLGRKTVKVRSFSEGLSVCDFHLPLDSQGRTLWIRQIIKADLPRFAELWWGLYDRGKRSDVWYFIPTPQFTENKILSNYEIVDASKAGNGAVVLRIQGSQFLSQGAWSIVGKVLTFSASDAGLAFSYVRNAFGLFKGYDTGDEPSTIDISTEQERQGGLEGRTFIAVPERVLRECRVRDPATDDNWEFSWKELERAALCVTKKPGVKRTFRGFDEPSFIERGRSGD